MRKGKGEYIAIINGKEYRETDKFRLMKKIGVNIYNIGFDFEKLRKELRRRGIILKFKHTELKNYLQDRFYLTCPLSEFRNIGDLEWDFYERKTLEDKEAGFTLEDFDEMYKKYKIKRRRREGER